MSLSDADLVHRYSTGVNSGAAKLAVTIGPEAAENYRRRAIEQAQRYAHNYRLSAHELETSHGRSRRDGTRP